MQTDLLPEALKEGRVGPDLPHRPHEDHLEAASVSDHQVEHRAGGIEVPVRRVPRDRVHQLVLVERRPDPIEEVDPARMVERRHGRDHGLDERRVPGRWGEDEGWGEGEGEG